MKNKKNGEKKYGSWQLWKICAEIPPLSYGRASIKGAIGMAHQLVVAAASCGVTFNFWCTRPLINVHAIKKAALCMLSIFYVHKMNILFFFSRIIFNRFFHCTQWKFVSSLGLF